MWYFYSKLDPKKEPMGIIKIQNTNLDEIKSYFAEIKKLDLSTFESLYNIEEWQVNTERKN
jgi:hypothetical protein